MLVNCNKEVHDFISSNTRNQKTFLLPFWKIFECLKDWWEVPIWQHLPPLGRTWDKVSTSQLCRTILHSELKRFLSYFFNYWWLDWGLPPPIGAHWSSHPQPVLLKVSNKGSRSIYYIITFEDLGNPPPCVFLCIGSHKLRQNMFFVRLNINIFPIFYLFIELCIHNIDIIRKWNIEEEKT